MQWLNEVAKEGGKRLMFYHTESYANLPSARQERACAAGHTTMLHSIISKAQRRHEIWH